MPARRRLILTLVFAGAVFGCETAGDVRYRNAETGETWRVRNPPKAQAPATLSRGPGGSVTATAGPPQRIDQAIRQLRGVPIIGAGLIVLGVASLAMRGWLPSVPMGASLAAMATGGVLIAAPKIVQEAWWALLAAIGAVGLMYAMSWWDNRLKLKGVR